MMKIGIVPKNTFLQRKKAVLMKIDKSSKKSWDKKITSLCNKINSLENSYTTSSCSGRVVLMEDKERKQEGLFLKIYHDLINFEGLKKDLINLSKRKRKIKFKQEPCILHVVCKSLDDARDLLKDARAVGWKRSGMITFGKNFVLELISTEKLEFPIIFNKKILVDDEFLRLIVKNSNKNLKKTWEKIKKLENYPK